MGSVASTLFHSVRSRHCTPLLPGSPSALSARSPLDPTVSWGMIVINCT